jgi:DNA polymerase-3 subunit alpha
LGAIESIVSARREGGDFKSLRDFCARVDLRSCNKKVLESLIKSGAFDFLGANRLQLLAILDETMSAAQTMQREKQNGQLSMFDLVEDKTEESAWARLHDEYPELPEPSPRERLAMEKEALGLYLSGHPLEEYDAVLKLFPRLTALQELEELPDGSPVIAAGMISTCKQIFTRAGKPMAFITLEDLTAEVEVVVFTSVFEKAKAALVTDSVVLVHGRISHKDEESKILAEKIVLLPQKVRQVQIRLGGEEGLNKLLALKELLKDACGTIPVYLTFPEAGKQVLLAETYWLCDEEGQLQEIRRLFGEDAVTVKQAG